MESPKARALVDYMEGAAFGENPFPPRTQEALEYQEEMDRLWFEEEERERQDTYIVP